MATFSSFTGYVTAIENLATGSNLGCYKMVTLQDIEGNTVNFIVSPCTYFIDHAMISISDLVTGFYDADLPVPLIYPPQYRAVVMAREDQRRSVKVDFFDEQLISRDGMLKLNLTPYTPVLLENGQMFTGSPANRSLAVVYGPTTRSIPAQTSPYEVIVLCREECV